MPCCDDEDHSRVSFTVMEKQMTQMLRFKVKTTPNKTTVRKMLQALFLQHFNSFILHGTFVVCQEIYIIFSKIKFFPLEYCFPYRPRTRLISPYYFHKCIKCTAMCYIYTVLPSILISSSDTGSQTVDILASLSRVYQANCT